MRTRIFFAVLLSLFLPGCRPDSPVSAPAPAAAIEAADWRPLEDVLTGRREPQVLLHVTRVVGYFSRVSNWNKSKLGELKDRHRGNYAIAG
jgi:hypothetical protein